MGQVGSAQQPEGGQSQTDSEEWSQTENYELALICIRSKNIYAFQNIALEFFGGNSERIIWRMFNDWPTKTTNH